MLYLYNYVHLTYTWKLKTLFSFILNLYKINNFKISNNILVYKICFGCKTKLTFLIQIAKIIIYKIHSFVLILIFVQVKIYLS